MSKRMGLGREGANFSTSFFGSYPPIEKYGEEDSIISFNVSISLQFPLIHVAKQMHCKPLHTRRWRSSKPFALLVNQRC